MSSKNKAKNRPHEVHAPQQRRPAEAASEQRPRPRRLTPIAVGIGLGVVVLGAAALLGPALRGRDRATLPRAPLSTTLPGGVSITAGLSSLPPAPPGTRVPLNDVDPVTGKPIEAASPTITYKGYVIGFCCDQSSGYRGGWERMSQTQKDAFVRRYLR